MTRDEMRAKVAREMGRAIWNEDHGYDCGLAQACAALDSLHGIARVCPIEATDEMLDASLWSQPKHRDHMANEWRAMSAAGDLTNQPEKKP